MAIDRGGAFVMKFLKPTSLSKAIKPVYKRQYRELSLNELKQHIFEDLDNSQLPTKLVYIEYFNKHYRLNLGAFNLGIELPTGRYNWIFTNGYSYIYQADPDTYVSLTFGGLATQVVYLSSLIKLGVINRGDTLSKITLLNKLEKYFSI
jgi:hypothetical protein